MRVRFLSGNPHKIGEAEAILASTGVTVVPIPTKLEELQSADSAAIVRDKVIKAFHLVGYPLFVEQTGLFIDALNGFPGGLTQVFWDTLEADRVCDLFGRSPNNGVTARTFIGFCDGRAIYQFSGELRGQIAPEPRGSRTFQWDCVFVPEGHTATFAEMGDQKNQISMRYLALKQLAAHLAMKAGNA